MKHFGLLVLFAVVFLMSNGNALYAQEETYEKAVNAYLKKDFKTAAAYLKEYVAHKPDAEAYYLLGYATYMIHRKSGGLRKSRGVEAADYFREAYLIDPNFSPKKIDYTKYKKKQ